MICTLWLGSRDSRSSVCELPTSVTGHCAPNRIASRVERYRNRFSTREQALDCCWDSAESLPDHAGFNNNQYFVLLSAFRGHHISDVKNAALHRNLTPQPAIPGR